MNNTMIARISPIFDAQGNRLNVYVPLCGEVRHENVIFEASDEAALRAISDSLPGHTFACGPEMEAAASVVGALVRPLTKLEAVLVSEIALGLNPPAGVPKTSNPEVRREFFQNLADLLEAPAWGQIVAGVLARGEAEGEVDGTPIRVGLTLGVRKDPVQTLLASIAGTGSETDGDAEVVLDAGPEYIRSALHRAYGLKVVPKLTLPHGPAELSWNDQWLPVLTVAIKTLAMIEEGRASIENNLQGAYRLSCTMRLLG